MTGAFLHWLQNALSDFPGVLNLSILASWLVLGVLVLRLVLRSAPKWIHVALWGVVALRLLLPFSIESVFSLIPSTQTIPQEVLTYEGEMLQEPAFLEIVTNPVYQVTVTPTLEQSADRVQTYSVFATLIWWAGMAAMALYALLSTWQLHWRVATAIRRPDGAYESEFVDSPFLLGLFRPQIYLPLGMKEEELPLVLAHERAHIQRWDPWWKALGFGLLTIHWFNPVLWLAYWLFCRDLELACDQKVIATLDSANRAQYSQALLSCALARRPVFVYPLAFGEVGVAERVKRVLSYKKPGFWLVAGSVVLCLVFGLCFLTDPVTEQTPAETTTPQIQSGGVSVDEAFPNRVVSLAAQAGAESAFQTFAESSARFSLSTSLGRQPVIYVDSPDALAQTLSSLAPYLIAPDGAPVSTLFSQEYDAPFFENSVLLLTYLEDSESCSYQLEYIGYSGDGMSQLDIALGRSVPSSLSPTSQGFLFAVTLPAHMLDQVRSLSAFVSAELNIGQQILTGEAIHRYVGENAEFGAPSLVLYDTGEFSFTFSLISSYWGYGHYTVEDDVLLLRTDDGNFHYQFRMEEGRLIFQADRSSEMVWFSGLHQGSVLLEEPLSGEEIPAQRTRYSSVSAGIGS